jgi:prephenate dehydrogenase
MTRPRIAIVGTGLIGTSIGLGLAARPNRNYEIVGVDRDSIHLKESKKLGAIDKGVASLEEAFEGTGLVIISVPVQAAQRVLQEGAQYFAEGAVVTDTASTKSDILRWAEEYLPDGVHFVGGHPMAGKEKSGPSAGSATLFQGATWAITPTARADESAVRTVQGMIESLGGVPLFIDAVEHDTYTAAVSHLPILVSVALFRMVRDSKGWEDASLLAGPGFRDLTRLASGNAVMSGDIVATNRDAILHWLERFQAELSTIRVAVEEGGDVVRDLFASTQLDRDTFILHPPKRRRPDGPPAPSAQDQLGQLLAGGLYWKLKDATAQLGSVKVDDPELRRKLQDKK